MPSIFANAVKASRKAARLLDPITLMRAGAPYTGRGAVELTPEGSSITWIPDMRYEDTRPQQGDLMLYSGLGRNWQAYVDEVEGVERAITYTLDCTVPVPVPKRADAPEFQVSIIRTIDGGGHILIRTSAPGMHRVRAAPPRGLVLVVQHRDHGQHTLLPCGSARRLCDRLVRHRRHGPTFGRAHRNRSGPCLSMAKITESQVTIRNAAEPASFTANAGDGFVRAFVFAEPDGSGGHTPISLAGYTLTGPRQVLHGHVRQHGRQRRPIDDAPRAAIGIRGEPDCEHGRRRRSEDEANGVYTVRFRPNLMPPALQILPQPGIDQIPAVLVAVRFSKASDNTVDQVLITGGYRWGYGTMAAEVAAAAAQQQEQSRWLMQSQPTSATTQSPYPRGMTSGKSRARAIPLARFWPPCPWTARTPLARL